MSQPAGGLATSVGREQEITPATEPEPSEMVISDVRPLISAMNTMQLSVLTCHCNVSTPIPADAERLR